MGLGSEVRKFWKENEEFYRRKGLFSPRVFKDFSKDGFLVSKLEEEQTHREFFPNGDVYDNCNFGSWENVVDMYGIERKQFWVSLNQKLEGKPEEVRLEIVKYLSRKLRGCVQGINKRVRIEASNDKRHLVAGYHEYSKDYPMDYSVARFNGNNPYGKDHYIIYINEKIRDQENEGRFDRVRELFNANGIDIFREWLAQNNEVRVFNVYGNIDRDMKVKLREGMSINNIFKDTNLNPLE